MLLTKLHIPSPGSNIIHRPNLIQKLNTGLDRKLILVSAPAGFGKTTLISDWIAHNQVPATWVSLDKRDNEHSEFLRYLIAGFQTIDGELGKAAVHLSQTPQQIEAESILSLVLNDVLNYGEDMILILDDFHVIQSREIIEIMKFLIDHLPPNLHLVVCSRSDPPLSISRLRSQNELVELRSADLSFTVNDTHSFLIKKLKLDLSIEDIKLLDTKTEGWIAGLQLSALSMQGRTDLSEFVKKLMGNNRYIMDYLLEEVLLMQADHIKEFLVRTSILEQVSGDLADTLLETSNSQEILELLEKNNMFIVPLDTERKWYRYHHLFGDLLKQRLKNEERDLLITLHERASDWFANHDLVSLAIEHAIEAGNHDRAMKLLDQTVEELWKSGQHASIIKFGVLLKEETLQCNPNFCLYYAWTLNSAGHFEEAEKVLLNAEKLALADLPNSSALLGKISVAFTYLLSSSRNTDRIFYYCEQARKYLKDDDPLWYSWVWLSYGVAYIYTGKLIESGDAFEKAFEYGKKSANLYLMTTAVTRLGYGKMRLGKYKYSFDKCKELLTFFEDAGYAELAQNSWANSGLYVLYGYIHYMWNKLDEALTLTQRGYELSLKGNDIITQIFATLFYAWILLFRGDKVKSESLVVIMEKSLSEKQIYNTLPLSFTSQIIKIYIKLGNLEKARELIQSLGLSIQKDISFLNEMAYISYAKYLIETSDYKTAESLIYKLEKFGDPGHRIESLIELKILGAALFNILENETLAKKYLNEALALGEEENLMIFFVEESDLIGDLLNETRSSTKFLTRIIKAIEKKQKAKQEFFMDPLSTREIEVLRYIEETLSNQEIADHIFVSINTVKTHVKSILLKLEVNNRSSAVNKARELGII